MTKKEQVMAQIAAAAVSRITDAVDSLYDNDTFVAFATGAEVTNLCLKKIRDTEAKCAAVVASMPIYSAKTRENRKWLPANTYGLGAEANALIRIATGMQYAATEHKQAMIAATGISEVVIDMVNDALGSLPYYNRNYMIVVDGKPANAAQLAQALSLLGSQLNVAVDVSLITEATMVNRYTSAKLRAEKSLAEAQSASLLSDGKVII